MPTEHQVCVSYLCDFAPVQIRVSVVVRCVWSGNHRWRLRCGPRLSDAEHLIGSISGTERKRNTHYYLLLAFTCGGKLPVSPLPAYQDAADLQLLEICYERSGAVVSVLGS